MAIALIDLILRLGEQVDGLSEAQLEEAVRTAVTLFSSKAGMIKRGQLAVVAGTAAYDLPTDALSVIRLESLQSRGHTMVTGQGLIPLGHTMQKETYTVAGKRITLLPTPAYTATRYIHYRAGHVLDANDVYPDMTDEVADIVMLRAQANALRVLAVASAPAGWRYSIGDVMVDKSNLSRAIREEAQSLDQQFNEAVAAYIGPAGSLSYGPLDQAGFI